MAVRLPLILSQPAKRDATAGELIENIVAAALLLPKLDANLVGDISCIELGSTDHLCLQGHGRDVILASFLEMASAEAAWHRLGQSGQFIDCHQSAAAIRQLSSSTTERRVFYFQLTHSLKIAKLLDQCQELVAAQAVQLVSIQLGGANPRGAGSLPIVSQPIRPSTNGHTHSHPPTNPAVTSPSAIPPASGQSALERSPLERSTLERSGLGQSASHNQDDDEDWSSIDKLVDELDAMDI